MSAEHRDFRNRKKHSENQSRAKCVASLRTRGCTRLQQCAFPSASFVGLSPSRTRRALYLKGRKASKANLRLNDTIGLQIQSLWNQMFRYIGILIIAQSRETIDEDIDENTASKDNFQIVKGKIYIDFTARVNKKIETKIEGTVLKNDQLVERKKWFSAR